MLQVKEPSECVEVWVSCGENGVDGVVAEKGCDVYERASESRRKRVKCDPSGYKSVLSCPVLEAKRTRES